MKSKEETAAPKVAEGTATTIQPFDPDRTMTLEEMAQRKFTLEAKDGFQVRRTTIAAHKWLGSQKLNGYLASTDSILWGVMILGKAKAEKRTLNLEEVQSLFVQRLSLLDQQKADHAEKIQRRPDHDAGDGEVTCIVTGRKFVPMVWNRTDREGVILIHENGPRQGEAKLGGNFIPSKDGEPKPISREGLEQLNKELDTRGEPWTRSYSYAEAKHLSVSSKEQHDNVQRVASLIPERKTRSDGGFRGDPRAMRHIR